MSEQTKQPSDEPVEIERLLTAVKDAQCLGETPERITVRVQKVYAAYLAQERTIATLRATVERLEQIIYAHSCENALKHDDWELSGEAYAIDERRRAAREKEGTDETER